MNSYAGFAVFLMVFAVHAAKTAGNGGTDEFFHEERDSLIQIRDSLSSTASLHSNWTGPPCHGDRSRWYGVTCLSSHVIGIDLQGIQLFGTLPLSAFRDLTYMTNLSLRDNALHGELPSLSGLLHLRLVSFSRNRFSGSIPTEYLALSNISQLELQDNLLNGRIPPFDQQSLTVFNVSYNFLRGPIPQTQALQRFSSSSYDNNLELCGEPLQKACSESPTKSPGIPTFKPNRYPSPPPPNSASDTKSLELWSIALIAAAAVTVPAAVILCFLCYKRRNMKAKKLGYNHVRHPEKFEDKKEKTTERIVELEFFDKERWVFDLDVLLRSSAEVIGKGKLGITYKATMESGSPVVVKRLKGMSSVTRKEFVQQMQLLGRLKHENLVEIITYYYALDEKLVIYEHVSGVSLFQLLHGYEGEGKMHLKWAARLSIVKGIARGLAYLHHSLPSLLVPHGNLKSSNVVVVLGNYKAKLTDYGFQELRASPAYTKMLAAGKSPEFHRGGRLSEKIDVFCFGVLLLEVIARRIPGEDGELMEWVKMVSDNKWSTSILDAELVPEQEHLAEIFKLVQIALECLSVEPDGRPDMSELGRRIEEIKGAKDEGRSCV